MMGVEEGEDWRICHPDLNYKLINLREARVIGQIQLFKPGQRENAHEYTMPILEYTTPILEYTTPIFEYTTPSL